ncbi:MAG: APC family permease [Eubacteriales bacterium]|nr:APC family permease [Eubacteriales bacterium]
MKNQMKEKYGLLTAIAMVVGIVIGSGVFFKAEKVLTATGGNLPLGILAWGIGGVVMIICACTFAIMATRYVKVNGLVDYAEITVGRGYAYTVGWFLTFIYYPSLTSVLAWVSARYIGVILGWDITGGSVMLLAGFLLIASYALNALSPVLAGKFQVSTTIIKLIPLFAMAIVGTIAGLSNGLTVENFTTVVTTVSGGNGGALLTAVVATAFAYEGWIIATSINAELKNAKRNLPIALVLGSIIIIVTYILYYIGLAGGATNAELMESGEAGAKLAFQKIFGNAAGVGLFVLVVISCLGTLNGLMLASTRGLYSIAVRDIGPRPDLFGEIDEKTNMPTNSSVVGVLVCAAWLVYFYGANLAPECWFGPVAFDSSELPIVTIYAFYIPIFIVMILKEKDLHPFKRFVLAPLAVASCVFMIFAAVWAHKNATIWYLAVFVIIMLVSLFFYKKGNNN